MSSDSGWRRQALALAGVSATLLAGYACGQTLSSADDPTPDSGNDVDAAGHDDSESSIPVGNACDRQKPFGPKADVPVSGAYSIEAARFNDGRTVGYLALCPADGNKVFCDLFQSPFANGAFGNHVKMTGASSPRYDSYPTVTSDGKFLVFASSGRDAGLRIYFAAANNGTFEGSTIAEQRFSPTFQAANEPYVLGSGKALYVGAAEQGLQWDIYRATAWGGDAPAPATKLSELASAGNEMAPVVTDDEEEIFFASNRLDPADDATGLDIYRAVKAPGDGAFGMPARLEALSGAGNDWPVWMSPDLCDLYFIMKDPATNVATLRVASRR